jgi:hypothetical protein
MNALPTLNIIGTPYLFEKEEDSERLNIPDKTIEEFPVNRYSTSTFATEASLIADEIIYLEKIEKESILIKNIGKKLYQRLNPLQKEFILNVTGTISFDRKIDIDSVYSMLNKIDYE